MAQEFLQGLQAAQQQTLGQLQIEDAVSTIRSRKMQQDKANRIRGYLGDYGGATPKQQRGIESRIAGEDIGTAKQLRDFRTSGEAEMSSRLGEFAAVAKQAIGTPEEPQAMIWLGQQAESIGVPRETIQEALTIYSQDPSTGARFVDGLMVRGIGAKDYLAQYDVTKQVAKEKRVEASKTRLEGLKQKGRLELETAKQKGKKPPARDQKITDTMTDYRVSKKEARDIVDGRVKVLTDPITGQTKLINIASGTERVVSAPSPATEITREVIPETDPRAPDQTVFDIISEGVGLGATIKEGLSTTAGQVFEGQVYPETTKARTKIKGLREKLIRALSLSGRPPVVEQERLVEMLPSTGIFESTGHATAQLTELHSLLSRQMMDDLAVYADDSKPKKMRGEAAERARGIGGMLRELGTPPTQAEAQTINTQEEYDALPSGSSYISAKTGKRGKKP